MTPTDPEEVVARIVTRAEELTKAGHKADAWRLLETALRRAAKDVTKLRLRDALLRLGSLVADPPSPLEEEIVAARIAAERVRWLREQSGRCYDRGQLHAALRLLEELGGALEEQTGQAVIGALADAKRAQKDLDDLRVRILGKASDEEKAEAQGLLEKQHGAALLKEARQRVAAGQYAVARILVRSLVTGSDHALAGEARALQQHLERAWLADTPPEQAAAVDAARNHPAFGRLATVASHKFLYLGPKGLVEGIAPESRLRYDLAFVFLTDLFGVSPNPGGDRITVFFKELWDFGGGQGGGKTIDIGRADPFAKGTRVDTGLLYHELTHCVDDTDPIYSGFREGLANFGAAYLFEMLGQEGDQAHAFASNLEAFRRDYLGRDLAYWRIQDYGPSAGFFLHFADKYTRGAGRPRLGALPTLLPRLPACALGRRPRALHRARPRPLPGRVVRARGVRRPAGLPLPARGERPGRGAHGGRGLGQGRGGARAPRRGAGPQPQLARGPRPDGAPHVEAAPRRPRRGARGRARAGHRLRLAGDRALPQPRRRPARAHLPARGGDRPLEAVRGRAQLVPLAQGRLRGRGDDRSLRLGGAQLLVHGRHRLLRALVGERSNRRRRPSCTCARTTTWPSS